MYCRQCGAEMKESSAYCTKCGQKVRMKRNTETQLGKIIVGLGIGCFLVIILVRCVERKQKEQYVQKDVPLQEMAEESEELTIAEQLEEIDILYDNGMEEEGRQKLSELTEKNEKNPEFYLASADWAWNNGNPEKAKEILLTGFEQKEDSALMEKYIDFSMLTYMTDEEYEYASRFADLLAGATDNTEKLEIAKDIYFYFNLLRK